MDEAYIDEALRYARKAYHRVKNPEAYPGLVERRKDQRKLFLWRYPSFAPYSSWSIFQEENYYWIRRIEWNQRQRLPEHPDDIFDYGCEALLANQVVNELLSTLGAIAFRPFQKTKFQKANLLILDGTAYGVEIENTWLSCRLEWRELPSDDWRPLMDWFERAVMEFEQVLPTSPLRNHNQ
ncbi:hypothetical protein NDA01_24470 [Trichocoleus desertorum AS-A10]|uniref:hypothetical protein n=1 Tax=Trichocoleus desertorum TaxID=1481672 RepID=UPI003299C259